MENRARFPVDRAIDAAGESGAGGPGERLRRRRLPRWLGGVALAGWYALVVLGCGEIGLRLASRAGILLFDVEMWRYARELKRPSDVPGVVFEHRPDADVTLMGVRVRTDRHGFRRAAAAIEAQRTGRERAIAVVGDSCALGWGVPEGETLGEQLEETLNAVAGTPDRRVAVLNASIGNSNTAMEYARYVADVRPLHPAWVILAFFVNDAEAAPRATSPPLLAHSVLLAMLSTRAPTLLFPAYRDYAGYYATLYQPGSIAFDGFQRALSAFGRAVRDDGALATLLLIPEMHEPHRFGRFADIYARVARLGEESGFEVVDPSDAFPAGSGEGYWVTPGDAHPDAKAHAKFADALARSSTARRLMGRDS